MVHQTIGTQTFTDEKNGIRCRLEFGNPSNRKGIPNDFFEGVIEQFDSKNPDAPGTALHQVQGSWLGFVDFDKTRYWDIRTTEKTPMSVPADMLKSDSRHRTDRKFLEAKDFKKAQVPCVILESYASSEVFVYFRLRKSDWKRISAMNVVSGRPSTESEYIVFACVFDS